MGFGQTLLNEKVERRQQITELVGLRQSRRPGWRLAMVVDPQAPLYELASKTNRHNLSPQCWK